MKKEKMRVLKCLLCAVFVGILAAGCTAKEAVKPEEAPPEEKEEEMGRETYRFVDVYGNQYEAKLLEDVPACEYDYSRLTEENGYKAYLDKDGKKISKAGIDVSKYQAEVDWNQVKDSGIEFVIIRLGYRGYGEEGLLVEDPLFRQHMEGALASGLEVGVYFFSQAVTDAEAAEEAQFVLERIKGYPITYPVVFDTEEIKDDVARTDGLSREQFTENCRVFCDKIEEAGYDTMIYANMKWLAFTLDLTALTEYDIWYADYEEEPQNPYAFSMWQYTEEGQVPGIEGNVDINLLFEDYGR